MISISHGLCAAVAALALPALAAQQTATTTAAGCGYVSTSAKPPLSEDLYPAEIKRIDGEDARKQNRHRLAIGTHAISIQEQIGSTPRGYTKLRKLGNREVALVYKVIEIEIEADASYQIAARLRSDQIDSTRPHAYWEPVVWRTTSEKCD
jgi:hypothetical protein